MPGQRNKVTGTMKKQAGKSQLAWSPERDNMAFKNTIISA